jgi:hypothetical protein
MAKRGCRTTDLRKWIFYAAMAFTLQRILNEGGGHGLHIVNVQASIKFSEAEERFLNSNPAGFVNKRGYSRVEAYIPLGIRRISDEEQARLRSRISGQTILGRFAALPEIDNQILAEWLQMINAKLDAVIRMMTVQREGFDTLPFCHVNISGGGVQFPSKTPFSVNDILELKMILPMHQPLALYVYAKVVNVDSRQDASILSVEFVMMDDMIRDELIRFVFEREREILREKRG